MEKENNNVGYLVEDCSVAGVNDPKTGESKIVAKDADGKVSETRGVATDPRERKK